MVREDLVSSAASPSSPPFFAHELTADRLHVSTSSGAIAKPKLTVFYSPPGSFRRYGSRREAHCFPTVQEPHPRGNRCCPSSRRRRKPASVNRCHCALKPCSPGLWLPATTPAARIWLISCILAAASTAAVRLSQTDKDNVRHKLILEGLSVPKRDWRDWFIMATVMGGVGYGLYFTAKVHAGCRLLR